jgi:hypothetical protein
MDNGADGLGQQECTESDIMNRFIFSLFLSVALTGCGADVVSTAATEAQLSAQQARQAQQLKDRVRSQLDAAMQTERDRMQRAEEQANN